MTRRALRMLAQRQTLAALTLLALAGAHAAAAQEAAPQDRRQITLDLRPVSATLGYARRVAPGRLFGVEAGIGSPQLEQTITPRGDGFRDFEEYLHLAVFMRFDPGARVEGDVGVRASFADVTSCDTSDCLPGVFGGAYTSVFYGPGRRKIGALVEIGRVYEPGSPATTVVNVSPLILRLKF